MNIKNIKFSLKGTLTLKAKFSPQIDLKIPRKTVETVFKYTDSIKRCDKNCFMQCQVGSQKCGKGTEKHAIGTKEHGIRTKKYGIQYFSSNAELFHSNVQLLGSNATLFGSS